MIPRLKELLIKEIQPNLKEKFGYKNLFMGPQIQKVVLNMGLGLDGNDSKILKSCEEDIAKITGQKPVTTRARKSIANFKLREGNPIGCSVTLRGNRMYYFLDRLINTALPRIRDFRGLARKGFDGRGNYSLGLREQIIFPEIDYNSIDKFRGLQVTINTSATTDEEAIRLITLFGMPFVRQTGG